MPTPNHSETPVAFQKKLQPMVWLIPSPPMNNWYSLFLCLPQMHFVSQRVLCFSYLLLYSYLLDYITDLPFNPSISFHIPFLSFIYVSYNLPWLSIFTCIYLSSIGFFASTVSPAFSFASSSSLLGRNSGWRTRHPCISWSYLQCEQYFGR